MREIKFRAWSDNAKIMLVDITPINLFEGGIQENRDCSRFINETQSGKQWNIRNMILMQYTGLKDKNGKEIYEGDIFKAPHHFGPGGWDERIGVVEWDDEDGYQWNYWRLKKLEVIGNIYENPELLNK